MIESAGNSISNQPAFKATLRVNTPVGDFERLKGIQRLFKEKTPEIRDILTISSRIKEYDNNECYYLGKKYENSVAVFCKDSLDTMMEKLSDNDIVTKMIKMAKSLKVLNKRDALYDVRQSSIYAAQQEQQKYLHIAQKCYNHGNEAMAHRFEVLAGFYGRKAEKIKTEQTEVDTNAYAKIREIAQGDEDISDVANLMV